MLHKNIVPTRIAGNTAVSEYVRNLSKMREEKRIEEALQVVDSIDKQKFPISRDIIYSLLQEYTKNKDLNGGRQVRSLMARSGLDSISVLGDHLIRLFAQCGSLLEADEAFSKVLKPSVYTFNSIISAHAKLGKSEKALVLYHTMQLKGIMPDHVTFLCGLKACGSVRAIGQGRLLHDQIVRSELEMHVGVGNMLVDMYAKCGTLEEAHKVFDELPHRDVVSWGAMMTGYAQQGLSATALELFQQMQLEGIEPNRVAFLCTLKACGSLGAIEQGRRMHEHIIRSDLMSDMAIGSTLVDMYAKCGSLEEAKKVFDKLPNRDVKSWGAIISGYSVFGDCSLVEQCFADMQRQGLKPDNAIFTSILASCSHAGLLEKGYEYFLSMTKGYCIRPAIEHYNGIVDLLGRAGCLYDAKNVLDTMPIPPNIIGWMSLLTSCRTYNNTELGRLCFDEVTELEPTEARGYMLMSNIYSDANMWDDVDKVQELRKSAGAWRKPGRSWVEIKDEMHEFTVGAQSNPQMDEISVKLKALNRFMKDEGHVPLLDVVLEPISELDKEATLRVHSENLGVVF